MAYFDGLYVLLRKNFKLTLRQRFSLILQLLAPLIVMLLLFFSDLTIRNNDGFVPEARELRNPEELEVRTIPRCTTTEPERCITIAYAPSSNASVVEWVGEVARNSGIPDNEVQGFTNSFDLNQFLLRFPNRTQAAYVFEESNLRSIDAGNVSFIVQFNETDPFGFPLSSLDWHVRVLVPSMITSMNSVLFNNISGQNFNIRFSSAPFPHPRLNADSDDSFVQNGPFLIFACYMLSFVVFLSKLVEEKEKRLREAMKLAGQVQSQHFISWGLLFLLSMTVTTFLLIAFGHVFRFDFFTRNAFVVYFLSFYIFAIALIPWVYLFDLLVRRSQTVSVTAFFFFILMYLLASAGSIVYRVDQDGEPLVTGGATVLREIFALFAPVMFVKCVQDMSFAAAIGVGISWSNIDNSRDFFPISTCWIWMAVTSVALLIIVIYLDNVIPNGYSTPLKPWYFLTASYWGIGKRRKSTVREAGEEDVSSSEGENGNLVETREMSEAYDGITEDLDVRREREAVESGQRENAALLIRDIRKKFGKVTAVDGIHLSVAPGILFALLGHNGAGKSTLFNMLLGITPITSGSAFIYGLDVKKDQSEIRKLLGVCPQHDVLWPSLTGAEHLEIFAALKGIRPEDRREEVDARLVDVNLIKAADMRSSNYSGGMQRRLSVAISLIGDPKILFLDEPTTGADPVARREVWMMIQAAKKDRVIVLVTHSMAEAETLGDRIGIVARGKLRVLGSALHLKNKFGAGYRLNVLLHCDRSDRVTEVLTGVCSGVSVAQITRSDKDGGSVLVEYSLDRGVGDSQMALLVKELEEKKEELGIERFGLIQSTLEDVFVRITSLVEDDSPDERRRERTWRLPFLRLPLLRRLQRLRRGG